MWHQTAELSRSPTSSRPHLHQSFAQFAVPQGCPSQNLVYPRAFSSYRTARHMMSRHGAVLFLSAMSAFLFREGFPFVLVSPSRLHTTKNSNPVQVVTASSPGCRRSAAGGRAATCSPLSVAAGSSQLRRKRQDKGMWMAGARVPDLWNGDSIPTPGWVRMAQRNMARIKPGDQLPDVAVR